MQFGKMFYICIHKLITNKLIIMTAQEMQIKIENKINQVMTFGYTKEEATNMVEKALRLVKEGKKKITDVIDL